MTVPSASPPFTAEPFTDADGDPAYSRIPDAPMRVLKFGSSVLRSVADLPRIVGEIYRQRRAGRRMIVVVSALDGETDELFGLARQAGGGGNVEGVADLVSVGEEKTAALLRIACARVGLDALLLRPEELCIHTSGSRLDADPDFIHRPALCRLAARHDLVIMPGFVGIDASGARSLLGRGGSDFTAIFIGGEIGADCVRLYKDVDGIFDRDPAECAGQPLRFSHVSWDDCLKLARPLLQPRAVEHARDRTLKLEVETIGSDAPTKVGTMTLPATPAADGRRLRIALAGFGAVGQAIHARLRSEPRFRIVSILVHDPAKSRGSSPPACLTASVAQFTAAEPDVLVEATSSLACARSLVVRQLSAGRHAVSANKKVVTDCLSALQNIAADGARLLYSGTVGGGVPVLETVALARRHTEIREVQGVLNGTVNFVLDRIRCGTSFDMALQDARRAGFPEADPAEDLSGQDVATKLRIIADACFGAGGPVDINVEPLDEALATHIRASGERWLQLATLVRGEGVIKGEVQFLPARFAPHIPLLKDEQNHIVVLGEDGRTWIASGRGAGGLPTAEAVVADLYDILRGRTCDGSRIPAPDPLPLSPIKT